MRTGWNKTPKLLIGGRITGKVTGYARLRMKLPIYMVQCREAEMEKIRCVYEHNGEDTILYAENVIGAYTRGASLDEALEKM